jgi:hypothetical protein
MRAEAPVHKRFAADFDGQPARVIAVSLRYPVTRAAFWAAVAMSGLIVGAYAYARRCQHLGRAGAR